MNNTKDKVLTWAMTPLSWLYGIGTWTRNKLFDSGVLKEESFDVPVVCVGNITVGGTGKTPHVEFLLDNLAPEYKVAVLSRGYRRKTKGFVLANSSSTPETIGDEPMQIYRKFSYKAVVAVCEKRSEGIREILRLYPDINLILLDDAFQHRYVKPKVSIVLMDYSRPIYNDRLLPLGRLRESPLQLNRADMVIVTKCPDEMQPINMRLISRNLALMPYQMLFFSRFEYGPLTPVFPDDSRYHASLSALTANDGLLLLTGVANPRSFVRYFKKYPMRAKVARFPDHHDFSRADIGKIFNAFKTLKGERKLIVTTEKDAVRLVSNPYFPKELKPFCFYLPVEVRVEPDIKGRDFIEELKKSISTQD